MWLCCVMCGRGWSGRSGWSGWFDCAASCVQAGRDGRDGRDGVNVLRRVQAGRDGRDGRDGVTVLRRARDRLVGMVWMVWLCCVVRGIGWSGVYLSWSEPQWTLLSVELRIFSCFNMPIAVSKLNPAFSYESFHTFLAAMFLSSH